MLPGIPLFKAERTHSELHELTDEMFDTVARGLDLLRQGAKADFPDVVAEIDAPPVQEVAPDIALPTAQEDAAAKIIMLDRAREAREIIAETTSGQPTLPERMGELDEAA